MKTGMDPVSLSRIANDPSGSRVIVALYRWQIFANRGLQLTIGVARASFAIPWVGGFVHMLKLGYRRISGSATRGQLVGYNHSRWGLFRFDEAFLNEENRP
jgi:hypothetical protein